MCITVNKALLTGTKILSMPLENGNHFLAYSNSVKNVSGKPNAMILPIPGVTRKELFHNTADYNDFLDEITKRARVEEDWMGIRSRGAKSLSFKLDKFELGMYTIGLTDSFDGVEAYIASLPEEKRPEISDGLRTFFQEECAGWSFAVCCFDSTSTIDAQPIALEYAPFDRSQLYFPTVDAHDGGAPDMKAMVDVDHTFIFEHTGKFEIEGERAPYFAVRSIKLDDEVPEFLRERKYRFVTVKGAQRNGDTYISIPDMSEIGILADPVLERRAPKPRATATARVMGFPKREDIEKLYDPTMPLEWYVWMQEELSTRCNYIVRTVTEDILGLEVEWWDFNNAPKDPNDGPGEFDANAYVSAFGVIGEFRRNGERVAILMNKSENIIPTQWIWMPDEEWQVEAKLLMSVGVTSDEIQDLKEDITRDIHQQYRKKMRDTIASKLTSEELRHVVFKA
jgi:hypothetical protein